MGLLLSECRLTAEAVREEGVLLVFGVVSRLVRSAVFKGLVVFGRGPFFDVNFFGWTLRTIREPRLIPLDVAFLSRLFALARIPFFCFFTKPSPPILKSMVHLTCRFLTRFRKPFTSIVLVRPVSGNVYVRSRLGVKNLNLLFDRWGVKQRGVVRV